MSELAIKVQGLSKEYSIGLNKSGSFRESFNRRIKHLMGKKVLGESFMALKDISFDVKKGEAVGIIGRNGAGKSTLLKILSRITEPTTGRIEINGRVSSLLEVGTGFHPELTGRENIYLNGTILGMTQREVKSKFDEIVDFSGVEKFIDTTVKHYSSGMQVRLAFSVAAHLEPEILIIDEVLAVGDAEFQKKCLGKMEDVAGKGRTVLFVSHNMGAIANLCAEGILLKEGIITSKGNVIQVLKDYQNDLEERLKIKINDRTDRIGNGTIRFKDMYIVDFDGVRLLKVFSGQNCRFIIEFENRTTDEADFQVDIGMLSEMDEKITWFSTSVAEQTITKITRQNNKIILSVKKIPFMPGNYKFTLFCKYKGEIADWVNNAFQFDVVEGDFYNTGKLNQENWGSFLVQHQFILD